MYNSELSEHDKDIMFGGGTEPPYSGKLLHEHRDGSYICKNCGELLFASDAKFDSGSGWPSFTQPANREHVTLITDTSHGMVRTEAICAHCGAHLGHVFDDGPIDKGGQRYCVNSACMTFAPRKV